MRIVAIIATNCIFAEMESSMKNNVAIKVKNVGMRFNLSQDRVDNLKEYMIRFLKRDLHFNEFWALREINFEVKKGERLGVLGLNGSGKSTLLKIVSGVLKPTTGYVQTKGKLAPLLELGAGFSQEYTGRENIYLYGAVLGYSKEFLDEKFDEIVDFSELGEFIDVPIKNYSSGMKSRLGFSIATVVEPEILILDEVLSVGDKKFRRKSEKKIMDMIRYPERLTYAGRLDKDSEGLILLTNDGDLINAMMRGANRHEKEYIVKTDREITPDFLEKMAKGIYLKDLDITTRECEIEQIGKFTFRIVLTQGVNRQIRRMCEACGYRVKALKRIRIMNILLGDLKPGKWREITGEELEQLQRDTGMLNRN